jgi:hypothetical protein
MQTPRLRRRRNELAAAMLAGLALLWVTGCSIHESKNAAGGDKKVEISTPFAQLKVNTDVDVKDTGLPLYPGARRAPESKDDKGAANVNISGANFGLKVVALKFESDDPADKVLSFYRDKLKGMGGKFLECEQSGFVTYSKGDNEKELTCGQHNHGDSVELKAGTPDNQHIVSVRPHGSGSEFALVYVSKHGREGTL